MTNGMSRLFKAGTFLLSVLSRSGEREAEKVPVGGKSPPFMCDSCRFQTFFEKIMKNGEKSLDIRQNIRYDNQVRVVGLLLPADTAMNREIAPQGGNFRGVCPIIGRLRNPDAA